MSGKQMEGDNERRRALARRVRGQGRQPSAEGVTLGGSKQPEHVRHADRDGPPPAGARKPGAETAWPPDPRPPGREWPRRSDPRPGGDDPRYRPDGHAGTIGYRDLVDEVGQLLGLDFDRARRATEATVTALARELPEADRLRLLGALPGELYDGDIGPIAGDDLLDGVARAARVPREQARYRAQAVLSTLAGWDPPLFESLDLPPDTRELLAPAPAGGGLVGPDGRTPPLTEAELAAALAGLPDWTGDRQALSRTVVRAPDDLDRLLDRLDRLTEEEGRGPRIARPADDTAIFVTRTRRADAVTVLDVVLAHRIDELIAETS